jgi:hypothetical protein
MAVLFAQAALADPRDFTLENDSIVIPHPVDRREL